MKVAVAYENGEICGSFGQCPVFALYEYGEYVSDCRKILVEVAGQPGFEAAAALLREREVAAVIVGSMEPEARTLLMNSDILPVVGYSGDADTAADLLVTGQLPPSPERGGCSCGCGGSCGEEGCGCGSGAGDCGGSCGGGWAGEEDNW